MREWSKTLAGELDDCGGVVGALGFDLSTGEAGFPVNHGATDWFWPTPSCCAAKFHSCTLALDRCPLNVAM